MSYPEGAEEGGASGQGGGGVKHENNGRIRWQPSLKGRISRAIPTEVPEEYAWELLRVSDQISRAPSKHTVEKSSGRTSKTWTVKRAMRLCPACHESGVEGHRIPSVFNQKFCQVLVPPPSLIIHPDIRTSEAA